MRTIDNIEITYHPLKKWWVGRKVRGITLNKKIYIDPFTVVTDRLLRHEYIHVLQQRECGYLRFLIIYFWEWIFKGYSGVSFEREAFANDRKIGYLQRRRAKNWKHY